MITLTLNDTTLTISEWVKKTGIPRATLLWRVNQGWDDDRVLAPKKAQVGDGMVCNLCGIKKPFSAFYKRAKRPGYLQWCKDCRNARARARKLAY